MKLYKSYRNYLLERDTLWATVSVFVVIGLFALLPLNLHVLDPIKAALSDFDFNDIAYAKLGKNAKTPLDDRIVIVNIGHADRGQIGGMLEKIRVAHPKVIAIDATFDGAKDSLMDAFLRNEFTHTPNLVLAGRLNWHHEHGELNKGFFNSSVNTFGYANFIGEERGTIRYFSPTEELEDKKILSFAATIVKLSNPDAFQKLISRHHEVEQINYKRKEHQYLVVDGNDVLEDRTDTKAFANKIVLMGYMKSSPYDIEDMHFTPMNSRFAGRTVPDMNGIVIHANIISMILDKSYVKKLPAIFNWIIYIIIVWLHVSLFLHFIINLHLWAHVLSKIVQLVAVIVFAYLGIILFHLFSFKIEMDLPLIAILLAVDVIYFYEALSLWLHKRYGYRTIFLHHNEH